MKIIVKIEADNVLKFRADVLALKYADYLYGADRSVVNKISDIEPNIFDILPQNHQQLLIDSHGKLGAEKILFLGVGELYTFRYKEIRDFARRVLTTLFIEAPDTKHLALTIHGVGYGLDELKHLNRK